MLRRWRSWLTRSGFGNLPPENLYGEEWTPPSPPIVNISPAVWSKLQGSGFSDWLPYYTRENLDLFIAWLCERALEHSREDGTNVFFDRDDNLVFTFAIPDPESREISWWKLTFELLDERASYYDLLRFERMA